MRNSFISAALAPGGSSRPEWSFPPPRPRPLYLSQTVESFEKSGSQIIYIELNSARHGLTWASFFHLHWKCSNSTEQNWNTTQSCSTIYWKTELEEKGNNCRQEAAISRSRDSRTDCLVFQSLRHCRAANRSCHVGCVGVTTECVFIETKEATLLRTKCYLKFAPMISLTINLVLQIWAFASLSQGPLWNQTIDMFCVF